MMGVTPKQLEFLNVLREFQELNDYTPSIREMGELLGISKTAAHSRAEQLIRRGRLRRIYGSGRSYEILEGGE